MRTTFVLLGSLTMSCTGGPTASPPAGAARAAPAHHRHTVDQPLPDQPLPDRHWASQVDAREGEGQTTAEDADAAPPRIASARGPKGDAEVRAGEAEAAASIPSPAPLPEGTVVLHVGSSTAGALGIDLKKELAARGVRCVLKFKESTFIPQWAGDEMGLGKLIANYNPDLVIISLGGNEVSMPNPGMRASSIRRIVRTVGDRPCLWIGTPKWKARPHTGILDVIRDNVSPCRYVDTDAVVPDLEPLPDGIHPTFPERQRWARTMIRWLEHNRDPAGEHPWSFKEVLELAPPR